MLAAVSSLSSQLAGTAMPGEDEASKKDQLPDEPRMVYIGNLPFSVKWQDLKDHMKQAGEVEFSKILTVDGSDWGRSRGVAYVRYATEDQAKAAIATLNDTELGGRNINVDVWTGAKPRQGGKGGGFGFKGDMMKGWGGKGWPKGYGKGWSKGGIKVHGDVNQMVYVGNLPFKAEWQELKDHMKSAGTVEFVKILTQDGTDFGQSKGIGCVRFATEAEADSAVAQFNGSELMGRTLIVDKWAKKSGDLDAEIEAAAPA
jgi:RNA recognition motif-containing protein